MSLAKDLPAPHALTWAAIEFGMPPDNRHGFQAVVEQWLDTHLGQKMKAVGKPKRSSVAWRAYSSMRRGSCDQCGDSGTHFHDCGPHRSLCDRCFAVLEKSRKHWIPNNDFPSAG